jgi:DnaK suppressor protein
MAIRTADSRHMLSGRRRELQDHVRGRIRDGRTDRSTDVRDDLEHTDVDIQRDVDVALLQMNAETLIRIDEALVRLDAGEYGACVECAGEISEQRLRALPFAVRCRGCEEQREQEKAYLRHTVRHPGLALYPEVVHS